MTAWRRPFIVLCLLATAACGRPVVSGPPAPSAPSATLEQFLAAVNANDLRRMGELWGTERGPSTVLIPDAERQQRLAVMQRLLQHDAYRIVSGDAVATSDPRLQVMQVELTRGGRRVTVPFTFVPVRAGGWLITEIGLDAAVPAATPRTTP